jgi:GTPase
LGQEVEEGNVEYKLKLIDPTPERFQQLVSQLKWRLTEGQGEALYEIGVEDNGFPKVSTSTLFFFCSFHFFSKFKLFMSRCNCM